ncbi:Cysteine--tRNA ligase, chloroplastic/mitochondrial, partial [Ananas comosus]
MATASLTRRSVVLLSSYPFPAPPRFPLQTRTLTLTPFFSHLKSPRSKRTPILSLSISSSASAFAANNGVTNGAPTESKPSTELHLYNTMTKQKELFRARVPGKVGMYVCGVTPYDLSHIGHARVYVTFDVLYRYLQYLGYDVCYVRNFTDIDDKIIKRANELRENPLSLSSRFCDEFLSDMAYLQCLPPSFEPRVTDHINQIINMIKQILLNGYAYVIEGDVYFLVEKFSAYGRLSGRKLEDNAPGERVEVDERKKNPADFALWKSAKEGEPSWDSPWGKGRPGWHIECSAMSATYLGHSFDIHGGGDDLKFPHHENEIAQSCAACSKSNISYWIHNGFVKVKDHHPLALRFFLLGTHYKSPVTYEDAQIYIASERLFYIYQTLHDCEENLGRQDRSIPEDSLPGDVLDCIRNLRRDFEKSMSDDLHTPVVLAALSEPLKIINDLLHTRKGKKRELRFESLYALEKEVRSVLSVLGLMPPSYHEILREKALKRASLTEEQVIQKIEERTSARENKEYERSDEIRKELADAGIALMDGPDGTAWRPAVPPGVLQQ